MLTISAATHFAADGRNALGCRAAPGVLNRVKAKGCGFHSIQHFSTLATPAYSRVLVRTVFLTFWAMGPGTSETYSRGGSLIAPIQHLQPIMPASIYETSSRWHRGKSSPEEATNATRKEGRNKNYTLFCFVRVSCKPQRANRSTHTKSRASTRYETSSCSYTRGLLQPFAH